MIVSMILKQNEIIQCDTCNVELREGDKVNMELDFFSEYAAKKCCESCLEDT